MVDPQSAKTQPIVIIKRKKVVQGDGHHGGAWKVAYADFVTAMMAFFLLMWLLNATTEEQRKGIADYFNPTIPISRISGGGSDGLNGSSMFTEDTYAKMGTGGTRQQTVDTPKDSERSGNDASTEEVAESLHNLREELSRESKQLSEHLMVKMSPEGMVLEVIDSDSSPLFAVGSSDPTPLLQQLLASISGSLEAFRNDIKIVGHTDSLQYRLDANYDNWNLSTDRANVIRKLLLDRGMMPSRLREVSGRADTDPLAPENPAASQNRRISIVILTDHQSKDESGLSAY